MSATAVLHMAIKSPSAIVVGAIVGLMSVVWWPEVDELGDRARFYLRPIAEFEVVDLETGQTDVQFAMLVNKIRPCEWVKPPTAYAEFPGGVRTAINVEEVGDRTTSRGYNYPAGASYKTGRWKMYPTDHAQRAVMIGRYKCQNEDDEKHVIMADIKLRGHK